MKRNPEKKTDPGISVALKGAPGVDGLRFRHFAENRDLAPMAAAANASWKEDLVDLHVTARDLRRDIEKSGHFEPAEDFLIAELNGKVVGYGRVTWQKMLNDLIVYWPAVVLLPGYRGHGIRRSLLQWCEERAREIAESHPANSRKSLEIWTTTAPNSWKSLVEEHGYSPSWYVLEMLKEDLDSIPEFSLPDGIEIRPVREEDVKTVWEAAKEALMDDKSYSDELWNDVAFEKFKASPTFAPEMWQIAWDGDEVVGGVMNYIDEGENRALGRRWGHTERIFVRRKWRRHGIARALISSSLKVVRGSGMEAATLDVDSANPSSAVKLYESFGYRVCRHFTFYRKPI